MPYPAAAIPKDPEPPVSSTALQQLDAEELQQQLFRSECFAEDLVDAYSMH